MPIAYEPGIFTCDIWMCFPISEPVTLKRHGVEARLILGSETAKVDHTLLRNIHRARGWYQQIIDGQTYVEVIASSGTWRSRISNLINFAFLTPDLLAQATSGKQPSECSVLQESDSPKSADETRRLKREMMRKIVVSRQDCASKACGKRALFRR